MKEIALSRKQVAKVDDEFEELVKKFSWSATRRKNCWYVQTCIYNSETGHGSTIYLHRLIMEQHMGRYLIQGEEIDHINGDGLDNQISNLRIGTHHQNTMNHGKHTQNCEYLGVRFEDRYKKPWRAGIMLNGKFIQLGNFASSEEAATQRDLGSIKFFGDFAKLNFEDKRQEYISKIRAGFDPIHHARKFTSEHKGVSYNSRTNQWQATLHQYKKRIHIGWFNTEAEAKAARDEYLKKLESNRTEFA